jgi:hypothetical protein
MNTDNFSALLAGPPLVFFFYELLNAKCANAGKILDHTHSVLSLITGVQMKQRFTGEDAATETVINPAIS